jgi:hypothetical protein
MNLRTLCTNTLCGLAMLTLTSIQGCKDPLEGDIPRTFELVSNGDWQQVEGLSGGSINGMVASGNTIIAGTSYTNKLFRSIDNGNSWSSVSSPPIELYPALTRQGRTFFATFYATTNTPNHILRSNDDGVTWQVLNTNTALRTAGLYITESTIIIAGCISNGSNSVLAIARSLDGGASWTTRTLKIGSSTLAYFTQQGDNIFVAFGGGGLFRSSDNGESWTEIRATGISNFSSLASNSRSLFATNGGLFQLSNNSITWNRITTVPLKFDFDNIGAIDVKDSVILVGTAAAICRSTDNGTTWTRTSLEEMIRVPAIKLVLKNNLVNVGKMLRKEEITEHFDSSDYPLNIT